MPILISTAPRLRGAVVLPNSVRSDAPMPLNQEKIGMTVGSGRTLCGALRSNRLRSSVDWATSRNSPVSRYLMPPWIEPRGGRTGAGTEIGLVDDGDLQPLLAEVAEQAGAIDARTDDEDVELFLCRQSFRSSQFLDRGPQRRERPADLVVERVAFSSAALREASGV